MISNLILRLLSHYWIANEPEEVRRAQVDDWIGDLAEFGPDIVNEACARWRISQSRRPVPADVRLIAVQVQREQNERLAPEAPNNQAIRASREAARRHREHAIVETRREGRDIVNKWAQAKGYDDLDAYCTATRQQWQGVYRQIIGEILANSPLQAAVAPLTAAAMGVTTTEACDYSEPG